MSYSSVINANFKRAVVELVLEGKDAGVPWMSDTLRSVADDMDNAPATPTLREHLLRWPK